MGFKFEKLEVWQKSIDLTFNIHELTKEILVMNETKYGKYIITELKNNLIKPAWNKGVEKPDEGRSVLHLDSEVLEGAFYVGCKWFWPRIISPVPLAERPNAIIPHKHDFDEVLAAFGSNPEDPHDLCGELEVWLGNEKHIITKSFIIFIPKGLMHGPIGFNRIDKPIFHLSCGPSQMYSGQM